MLPVESLIRHSKTLTERLSSFHAHLLETFPDVDRIACALYDPKEDLLKTFINSTRGGNALKNYCYKLSDSRSLKELAKSGKLRLIDDIGASIVPDKEHSAWLIAQGFRSSFTVPLKNEDEFYGFVFFDSRQKSAFTPELQRNLVLHSGLVGMLVSNEMVATRTLLESTRIALELAGARDFETGMHLERVAKFSELIARKIASFYNLDDEFIEMVRLFAPLHDVGKIGIPDSILLKPGRLDADERKIMQSHVERGVKIVDRTMGVAGSHEMPDAQILRNIVLCHHEFLDGSGYPGGLKGDDIPLEARIVTVADVFDALTSYRHYKKQWTNDAAMQELQRMADKGQIDRQCLLALINSPSEIVEIQERYCNSEEQALTHDFAIAEQ